ncbi:MAG: SDR family oxidoreductase [Gaiellaceae bacterium]
MTLLTGASGYVGGRLLSTLEGSGVSVRCLARRPANLSGRVAPSTEVVQGDVLVPESLGPAMEGVEVAYYLVHSMAAHDDYAKKDRQASEAFARAAREAGVRRIVYLGGLGRGELSPHLASRQEVGRILRGSGVETIELRASVVIGSGSLSFELIRGLVERLPVMITPTWVETLAQPIAIEDVISYLVEAANVPLGGSDVFEIGGPDRVTYGALMREYARQRGLRRRMLPVPILSPRLSSLWLGLVTPVYARVGRKLIESLQNETIVDDPRALTYFSVRPRGMADSVARALVNEDHEFAQTRWSDAVSSGGLEEDTWAGAKLGQRIVDTRARDVAVEPERAFESIRKIGGTQGWYYADWAWRIRGFVDLLVGGVGLRRGRRDPRTLAPGDALDFWRVEAFEPPSRLRLRAEMRLPGRAWLTFEVGPANAGSRMRQTAIFDPAGVAGRLYWYGLYPIHQLIFRGMLRRIAQASANGA